MIKIILEISEDIKKFTENLEITGCKVECKEIGRKCTRSEKKCSELLKERIGIGKSEEVINLSKEKDKEKIIDELLKNIF